MKINAIPRKVLLATAVAFALCLPSVVMAVASTTQEPTQLAVLATLQGQSITLGTMNSAMANTSSQISNMNQYLQTGFNGNGLIPLLSSINDKLGKSGAHESQAGLNENMAERNRIYDKSLLDLKAAVTPTQEEFLRACIEVTNAMTNRQGHGAAGGYSDAQRSKGEDAVENEERFLADRNETQALADYVRDREAIGTCTKQDLELKSPGCVTEGKLPGADRRASSITKGATSTPSEPSNGSLDKEQFAAAEAVIRNVLPNPPGVPNADARTSAESKAYLAHLQRMMTRQSFARDALYSILNSHAEMPVSATGDGEIGGAVASWRDKSTKESWARTFGPQMEFPANPSERDILRYKVFSEMYDPTKRTYISTLGNGARGQVGDMGLIMKEQFKMMALQNQLLMQLLERQEDANMIMAATLSHQIDPMTSDELKKLKATISRAAPKGAAPASN